MMYAQVTLIQAPLNQMSQLREVIQTQYLPVVREQPGFRAGYLLEKADDSDRAELVLFWENHAAVENFNRTGLLQASIHTLAAEVPSLRLQREGYLVRFSIQPTLVVEAVG